MAFDFPNSPTPGSVYSPYGGPSYTWDGQKWVMTGSAITYTPAYDQRNRVVNPAFQIAQEQTSTTANGGYFADQWAVLYSTSGGTVTGRQTTGNYSVGPKVSGLLIGTADTSIAAIEYLFIHQPIEASRIADFQWGTIQAKPAVLRFSALAVNAASMGTFYVGLREPGATASFVSPFVLNTTSWQDFTIPIPACTIGTWATGTAAALWLSFSFAEGANGIAPSNNTWLAATYRAGSGISNGWATAGNDFRIANVGLYLDPTGSGIPPAWEMPDEAQELAACQRYYRKIQALGVGNPFPGSGVIASATIARIVLPFNVVMRTTPTGGFSTASDFAFVAGSAITPTGMALSGGFTDAVSIDGTISSGTVAQACYLRSATANASIALLARM